MSASCTGGDNSNERVLRFRTKKRYLIGKLLEIMFFCGIMYGLKVLMKPGIIRYLLFFYISVILVLTVYPLRFLLGNIYTDGRKIWERFPLGLRGRCLDLAELTPSWHIARYGIEELRLESDCGALCVGEWLHDYRDLRWMILEFDESSKIDAQIRRCVESILENGLKLELGYFPIWGWLASTVACFSLSILAILTPQAGELNVYIVEVITLLFMSFGCLYFSFVSMSKVMISAEGISFLSPRQSRFTKFVDISNIEWGITSVRINSVSGDYIRCNKFMKDFDKLCILLRYHIVRDTGTK